MARASVSRTLRARSRSAMNVGALCDRVEGLETKQQRLEQIQLERVLRVAPGSRRILVHLEEHAINAGRNPRRCQRSDVLRESRRHAVAAARQLQAVGD